MRKQIYTRFVSTAIVFQPFPRPPTLHNFMSMNPPTEPKSNTSSTAPEHHHALKNWE
jgi:hypothetical protein